MPTIGIDLGTTYSCVAVWRGAQVEIIANAQGNRITPSYVAFTENDRLTGDEAKNQIAMNPTNTVFDAKRLIGKDFADSRVQSDMKHWPFIVVNDKDKPKIRVECFGEKKDFFPEEISAMVLEKMKEIAEAYLGEKINDAVITVPAYFDNSQRQATKTAGKIAGLNVLRIINEPTAAALAYGLDKDVKDKRNILVFDLGGGTADVSIMTIDKNKSFDVKSTAGNIHLGGEDFDSKIVDYLCNEFKKKYKKNIMDNPRALRRLRTAAVHAKQNLSSSTTATIVVDSLIDGIDFCTEISRAKFENLCTALFTSAIKLVEKALIDANIDKMSIHDIVLVGGSTRIPKIRAMLQNFFCGKQLNYTVNPDEAIAYGAAVQAALLTGEKDKSEVLRDVCLLDVTPLSLALESVYNKLTKDTMIKRNTKIPCERTLTWVTGHDYRTWLKLKVYEGEKPRTSDNMLLGAFNLQGIKAAPRGKEKIDVTFKIDENGILHVEASDRTNGVSNNITITNAGCLSQQEIDAMVSEAEKRRKYDKEQRMKIMMENQLKSYIECIQNAICDSSFKLTQLDKNQVSKICEDAWQWLASNRSAKKENYEQKMIEVQCMCTSIMKKQENKNVSKKDQLNAYILSIRKIINDNVFYKLTDDKKNQLIEICEETEKWIQVNQTIARELEWSFVLQGTKRMCEVIIDNKETERMASVNELESYIASMKLSAEDSSDNVTQDKKNQIIELAKETNQWLENHRLDGKEMLAEKLQKIKQESNFIMTGKNTSDEVQGGFLNFLKIKKEII